MERVSDRRRDRIRRVYGGPCKTSGPQRSADKQNICSRSSRALGSSLMDISPTAVGSFGFKYSPSVSARFQAHLQKLPCDCEVATFSFRQVANQLWDFHEFHFLVLEVKDSSFILFSVHEFGHILRSRLTRLSRRRSASAFIFM